MSDRPTAVAFATGDLDYLIKQVMRRPEGLRPLDVGHELAGAAAWESLRALLVELRRQERQRSRGICPTSRDEMLARQVQECALPRMRQLSGLLEEHGDYGALGNLAEEIVRLEAVLHWNDG